MKLISLYIENFGNLSSYKYNFNEHLNCFLEENGYGKTTLVSFIKAMFYGLENHYSSNKFNERVRFLPFNNNKFGGNIEFEFDGDMYRLERTFSKSKIIDDTLVVYKNGKREYQLEKEYEIGTRFFGIDKESFTRVLFITSDEIDVSATSSISSKLGMTIYGGDEKFNLDKTIDILDEQAHKYRYKKTLGKGLIADVKKTIADIDNQIINLNKIKNNISFKYNELAKLQLKKDEITSKINSWQEAVELNNINDQYNSLLNNKKEVEEKLFIIKNKYPYGFPLDDELSDVFSKIKVNENLKKTIFNLSDSKLELLTAYEKELITKNINHDDQEKNENVIKEINSLQSNKETLLNNLNNLIDKNKQINEKFKDEKEATDVFNKVQNYISLIGNNSFTIKTNNKNNKYLNIFIYLLCFLVLISGVVTSFFNLVIGIILIGIGIIGSLVALLFFKNLKNKKQDFSKDSNSLNEQIKELLTPYNLYEKTNILNSLTTLLNETNNYLNFIKQKNDFLKQISTIDEEISNKEKNIISILSNYYLLVDKNNYKKYFIDLKNYLDLIKEQNNLNELNKNNQQKIKDNQDFIDNILNKYHLELNNLDKVENDVTLIKSLTLQINDIKTNIEKFYKEKKEQLVKFQVEEEKNKDILSKDLSVFHQEKEVIDKQFNSLEKQISQDEDEISKLDDLEYRHEVLSNKKNEYIKNYELITRTIECITEADRNLNNKYLMPIVNNFTKYANLIEKTLSTKFKVNSKLEIYFDIAGSLRSDKHLSSGNKAICELCFRLALIDNMYKKEKPFVLLDDPFVQLDENHLINAIEIIKEISKDIQIVYLTCHESRKI